MTNDHRGGARYYDPSERITGNGFDIGNYEQISTAAKEAHQIGARIYSTTTTEYIRDV